MDVLATVLLATGVACIIFFFKVPWNTGKTPTERDLWVAKFLLGVLCLGIAMVALGLIALMP